MATVKLETVLAYVPLFRGLTKRQLKHLATLFEVADYMPGAAIVKQGSKGDAFYVVLKGQAKVASNGRFIRRMLPGDHFGEVAAIDGQERSATVTSETPMTLAIMTRPQLMEALRDDPDISYKLMVELARMFRAASAEAYG